MEILALEDLKDLTSEEVKKILAEEYSGKNSDFNYGSIDNNDIAEANQKLADMDVLVAYQSVGSWGCDSSAFFILKNKENEYFEVHASHCSCYGFEGQLYLEKTTLEALKVRAEDGGLFYTGGYDENEESNKEQVKQFVLNLKD